MRPQQTFSKSAMFMALLGFGGGFVNAISAICLFMSRTDFQQFLWHAATAVLAFVIGVAGAAQLRKAGFTLKRGKGDE